MIEQVIYFGGYKSTHRDVVSWKHSLEAKLPEIEVTVFHYPDGASASNPFEVWDDEKTEYVVSLMNGACILVGHSSGCAIANEVAATALRRHKPQFKLLALDGETPEPPLMALPGTQRWSAMSYLPGGGTCKSLNYAGHLPPHYQVYRASVCKRWPLHFSLVNLNVNDAHADIHDGYYQCEANLQVLGLPELPDIARDQV